MGSGCFQMLQLILGNTGDWKYFLFTPFVFSGSESCSSVGSSSSSLSRPQLALPVSGSSWSNISSAHLIQPAADTRGSAPPEMIKSVPSQPPSAADTTGFFVLPLDASGIPPGSVLVSPHTGGGFLTSVWGWKECALHEIKINIFPSYNFLILQ